LKVKAVAGVFQDGEREIKLQAHNKTVVDWRDSAAISIFYALAFFLVGRLGCPRPSAGITNH
jgi:hypothetical protein